jgi:pyrroloquinoline-quinone synthase
VANRFYYQINIPIKDAAILANCPDRAVRRNWVQRILDHDGYGDDPAASSRGCAWRRRWDCRATRWRAWTEGAAGVRFAVDAYVNFARRAPWPEAVCSSLTELFAPEIHKQRLANWPQHYPWIDPGAAVFSEPGEPGAPRRGIRPGLHAGSLRHSRPAGARARDPQVQARRAVADERCHGAALRVPL